MHYERTLDIAAPTEVVWRVLVDVPRWPEWTRSERSAMIEGGGPLAVGSRARLGVAGSPTESVWKVTSLYEGRSFVWENRQPGLQNIAGHYIEPADAGSRVRLTVDMSGLLSAIMRPYLSYVTRRNVAWEIEGLKRRSESVARA
jgi:hypothetical protein